MTLTLRDFSDYDPDPVSFAGLSGATHKATEGTMAHTQAEGTKLAARLGAARAAGVPVLGSYHVLRTPGNGGAGSLQQQLAWWVGRLDSQVPWWRSWPNWVMQIDAEKWAYDNVAASTVLSFANLLTTSGLPGWKVTYASRGQYGDSLTGIATPLWNADYRAGTYPGDTAVATDKGATAYWAPYSAQVPVLLQWNGGPDLNAYRGSLDQLLALTGGDMFDSATIIQLAREIVRVAQSGAFDEWGFDPLQDPVGKELTARAINPIDNDPTNPHPNGRLYGTLARIQAQLTALGAAQAAPAAITVSQDELNAAVAAALSVDELTAALGRLGVKITLG